MRPFILAILTISAALSLAPSVAPGGWGPHGCGPVGPMAMMASPRPNVPALGTYEWGTPDARDGEVALYRWMGVPGWVQVGSYRDGTYRILRRDRTWTGASEPPIAPPASAISEKTILQTSPAVLTGKPVTFPLKPFCAGDCFDGCECDRSCTCGLGKPCATACPCVVNSGMGAGVCALVMGQASPPNLPGHVEVGEDGKPVINYGMDWQGPSREKYKHNGKEIPREQAFELVEGGNVPDDANKLRLTVIGQAPDRQRVLQDIAAVPALAPVRDKCLVQDYAPTDWAVAGSGFVTTGQPSIYLQAPDGKVLLRQTAYEGAVALAEAVRKADPLYDPSKDPDGKPKPPPVPVAPDSSQWPLPMPVCCVLGGGALALFLLLHRGK